MLALSYPVTLAQRSDTPTWLSLCSLVNKQTALGALKGSQRKAVIEKVVFDLVPLPDKKGYYYVSLASFIFHRSGEVADLPSYLYLRQLPAVFTLHDEIKEKKRTLKKEGEYDAWIDAKKKERKEQATSAKERADATWVWLRKYKQFGKVKRDEIRDALNREQTAFTDKRRNAYVSSIQSGLSRHLDAARLLDPELTSWLPILTLSQHPQARRQRSLV